MTKLIKDKSLIVTPTKRNHTGGYNYQLKSMLPNGDIVKLSHAFNFLPLGIIDKTETGIGGTSLELDALRNSIVVEPFVLIARTKAEQKSLVNKFEIHYFTWNYEEQKYSAKSPPSKLSYFDPVKKLSDYIERCKKLHNPLKIICTTDQLKSLRDTLNGNSNYKMNTFHLVLDEIDCLQEHSNFRRVMDLCVDIYKEHPKKRRTLISATIKTFHDPILKEETFTKISYQNPIKKPMSVIRPPKLIEEVYAQIKHIATNDVGKIVIACNHIEYCYKLAKRISDEPNMKGKTVKILCGTGSEKKIKNYFGTIGANGLLPADINLITSAYFNGLDILESYHNIIVADGIRTTLRLSTDVMYQIVGRCRKNLLSSRLIVRIRPQKGFIYNDIKGLEEQSEEMCLVDNTFQRLKKSKNLNVVNAAKELQDLVVSGTKNYYSLCSVNSEGVFVKSYLKIDSRLEQEATHRKYEKSQDFIDSLSVRFDLKIENPLSTDQSNEIPATTPDIEGKEILSAIRLLRPGTDYGGANSHRTIENKPLRVIYNICYLADQLPNIDIKKLDALIISSIQTYTYQSQLKKLHVFLEFHLNIIAKSTPISRVFQTNFPLNSIVPRKEIEEKCNDLNVLAAKSKGVKDEQIPFFTLIAKRPRLIMDAILQLEERRTNKARLWEIVSYKNEKLDVFI